MFLCAVFFRLDVEFAMRVDAVAVNDFESLTDLGRFHKKFEYIQEKQVR